MKKLFLFLSIMLIANIPNLAQTVNMAYGSFDYDDYFPPSGWSSEIGSGDYDWEQMSQNMDNGYTPEIYPPSGDGMAMYDCWDATVGSYAMLYTNAIDLSDKGSATIGFYMYRFDVTVAGWQLGQVKDEVRVLINTSPSISGATELDYFYNDYSQYPIESTDGWYYYTIDIDVSKWNGSEYYIIFKGESNTYAMEMYIDEVTVDGEILHPDAGISSITSPKAPFSVGKLDIMAILNNYGSLKLTSCDINWKVSLSGSVLGSGKTAWTGNLAKGENKTVSVTSFDFKYPTGGPYSAFDIEVWTSNPNGDIDQNTGNDLKKVSVTPRLNDAGVIGVFGPVGGFGPGLTNLRARVQNFGPKPLSSVIVNWSVDGATQTPFTATGLNIQYGQTADINIGQYDFQIKTPLAPYAIKAWTTKPNAATDDDASNDTYTGGIGPSLVAGRYYIGGANYHFKDLNDAVSYLNSSSIMGTGTVEFFIRPGFYDAQLILNFPYLNNNPVVFCSSTGNVDDVVITASSNALNNYIFAIDGVGNITFKNLKFINNNSNNSFAGTVFDIKNASNITVTGCAILGVNGSPRINEYRAVVLNNTNNLAFTNNSVNSGSIGIDCNLSNLRNPTVLIDNNEFVGFSQTGINYSFTNPILPVSDNVIISNNDISSPGGLNPRFGINAINCSKIINNRISDIVGSNSDNTEAAIKFVRTLSSITFNSEISGNKVDNCTNVNGIYANYLNGTITGKLYRNLMNVNSNNQNLAGMQVINSVAYFGNNMVMGTAISMKLVNPVNNYLYYNSIVNTSSSNPALDIDAGNITMKRNIIANLSTGYAIRATGAPKITSDENDIFTSGTNIASLNAGNISNLVAWQNATNNDKNSMSLPLDFEEGSLHLTAYIPQIILNNPIFNTSDFLYKEIENNDYDGDVRGVYYIGADNLQPVITIYQEPEDVRVCFGTKEQALEIIAGGSYNINLTFHWLRDGIEIPGQTKAILNFDDITDIAGMNYDMSGLYTCRITGEGGALDAYTEGTLVYVYGPTEFTRPPANTYANIGDNITIEFQVHTTGLLENDLWQPEIQWYRNDTPLNDDERISGTKSSVLKIRDINASHFGNGYSVKVKGLCGEVMSAKFSISLPPDINIRRDLSAVNVACEGIDVILTIDAEAINGGTDLTYQWRYNGNPIPGEVTNSLTINSVKPSDEGDYDVVMSIKPFDTKKISNKAQLIVDLLPFIITNPVATNATVDEDVVLFVKAGGTPPLDYQWYKDATLINGATSDTFKIQSAKASDNGVYYCAVHNLCGTVQSKEALLTVTYSGNTSNVNDAGEGGYILSDNVPNPFSDNTTITFISPKRVKARLVITNILCSELFEIYNGQAKIGENKVVLNTTGLNLNSGVYYYSLIADGKYITKKMLIIK